jgi:hypothetical protein
LNAQLAEVRFGKQRADLPRVVEAVREGGELQLRIAGKERADHLVAGARVRILVDAVPDIEQEHAAFAQHAAHRPEGGRLVEHEHDSKRAHHRAEGRVRERKRSGIRFPPLDARGLGELGAGIVEHRPGEIGSHQPHRGIEALAQAISSTSPGGRAGSRRTRSAPKASNCAGPMYRS